MEPRCEGLYMKPIKMRRLDFPLPRVGDFFSRKVASLEFSSRNHFALM